MEFLHLLRRVRFMRDSVRHLQGVRVRRVRLDRAPDGGVRVHLYVDGDRVYIATLHAEAAQ